MGLFAVSLLADPTCVAKDPLQPNDRTQDLAGHTKDNAPEWTANLFAQFEPAIPRLPWSILGYVRAEYAYRDNFYLAQDLDPHTLQSAYDIVNFRLGARAEDELWDVAFWMQNATDTEYLVAATDVRSTAASSASTARRRPTA